ncbi:MAG TPA: hypothetical protein VIZ65_00110 [Cellvibrionaceae bacterium]
MKPAWYMLVWPSLLSFAALSATGGETAVHLSARADAGKPAAKNIDAPNDSEFWELYDELADEDGRIPAPEEIPPPKEPITPSREPQSSAAPENL